MLRRPPPPPPEVEAIFSCVNTKGLVALHYYIKQTWLFHKTFGVDIFTSFSDLVGTKTGGVAASHLNSLSRFTSSLGLHRAPFQRKILISTKDIDV